MVIESPLAHPLFALYMSTALHFSAVAGPHAASAVYVVNGVVGLSFMNLAKRWLIRTNPVLSVRYAYLAAAIVFASVSANGGIIGFAASHLTAGYPPSIAPPLCRKRVR